MIQRTRTSSVALEVRKVARDAAALGDLGPRIMREPPQLPALACRGVPEKPPTAFIDATQVRRITALSVDLRQSRVPSSTTLRRRGDTRGPPSRKYPCA